MPDTEYSAYKREGRELVDEEKRSRGRPKKEIDKEKIFQLKKEGKSIRKIAKELKISRSTVERVLNKQK